MFTQSRGEVNRLFTQVNDETIHQPFLSPMGRFCSSVKELDMNENFGIYSVSGLLFVKPLYRKKFDINVYVIATVEIYV